MNRRAFFQRTFGAIAAAACAPFCPKTAPITFKGIPLVFDDGTYAAINRATYSFWRNQSELHGDASFDALKVKMREVYNDCR